MVKRMHADCMPLAQGGCLVGDGKCPVLQEVSWEDDGPDGLVTVTVTEYTVSAWPRSVSPGAPGEQHLWDIVIRPARGGLWVVTRGHGRLPVMTKHGSWSWNLPRQFIPTTCFMSLDRALVLAKKAAPTVTVNGMTVDDAVKRLAKRTAEKEAGEPREQQPEA